MFTIDNFNQIVDIINGKAITDDNFFFVQILKRRKENPEMTSNNITCDVLYVKDAKDLLTKQTRIMKRCFDENARAYINLNVRSKRKVALQTMKIMAECIANDNYNVANAYTSAVGNTHSDPNKTWVIDIDYDKDMPDEFNQGYVEGLSQLISNLIVETGKTPKIHKIPTKNGIHLITQPFNTQKFGEIHGNIDIHKDNPTILFVP
jgi:hypothetical protein